MRVFCTLAVTLVLSRCLAAQVSSGDGTGTSTNSQEAALRSRISSTNLTSTGSRGSTSTLSGPQSGSSTNTSRSGPATDQAQTSATSYGSGVVPADRQQIDITAQGAQAHYAPHVAVFASDASQPQALKLSIPSGTGAIQLNSQVVGLGLWNFETGDAVLFAWPQTSAGEIISSTQVQYTNFLEGTEATLLYTYTADSFDQTIILYRNIPSPADLGLNGEVSKIRLFVATEFVDPPAPVRVPGIVDLRALNQQFGVSGDDQIPDETLFWGSMKMGRGRSFMLSDSGTDVPSSKSFLNISNHWTLIESTPLPLVRAMLDSLPTGTMHASVKAPGKLNSVLANAIRTRPRNSSSSSAPMIARASRPLAADGRRGLALDYLMTTAPLWNIDFYSGSPTKIGFAAVGKTATDYWNPYDHPYASSAAIVNATKSDGTASTVGISVTNAQGQWGFPISDAMYQGYIYSWGGDVIVTITNLPANTYNLYVYGHSSTDIANSDYALYRAGTLIEEKGTSLWGSGWNSTNWEPGIQYVVFKNVAVASQTIQILVHPGGDGFNIINGLQIALSDSVVPASPNIIELFNVDFSGATPSEVGQAAVGIGSSDHWNDVHSEDSTYAHVSNLADYANQPSTVGLTVLNAPGGYGWSVGDQMYSGYEYPWDGGNITVLLTDLPAGNYDLYLYGHGPVSNANTIFQLWSGERDFSLRGTTIWGSGWNSAVWDEGQQYVVFHDVSVNANDTVTIVAGHNDLTYSHLNGMQIVYKGSGDSDGDGLPDAWETYNFGSLDQTDSGDLNNNGLSNLHEYQLGFDPTATVRPNPERPSVNDAVPIGAYTNDWNDDWQNVYAEGWNWTDYFYDGDGWGGGEVSLDSGQSFHISDLVQNEIHQHWFDKSVSNVMPRSGDSIYAYINLDSTYPPDEIMLQFYVTEADGSSVWEHRAYWGANNIDWGSDGTASRYYAGALPAAGQWVRLEVPASALELEGKVIQGIAFTLYGGRAAWASAGSVNPDMDQDGLPDWWQWKYFGSLAASPDAATGANGDYDGDGVSNLDEYLNGNDPNKIQFLVHFPIDRSAATTVNGTIEVVAGVPSKVALLINSSDFSSATWQPYSSTFNVALGPADGRNEVWVGLKGDDEASQQTWSMTPLTLDRVPPLVVITNPVASTVSQPMIQLQGYSPEPLSSVRFDVSNGAGTLLDQEGYRVAEWIDQDRLEFTTNWFQCQDISLAPGPNTITLYITDRAGNVTTTACTYNLDYSSDTTPPAIVIAWPPDGTKISGNTFTCRGTVDDATASMSATMVDGLGNTTTVGVPVERNGKFWAENIPITSGDNHLTIGATDVAGNRRSGTITVTKSAVALTIDPISDDLWQSTVRVSGTVGDSSYTVSVNGVQATVNDDGTWSADDVPVNDGNTASFVAEARAPGQSQAAGAVGSDSDKGPEAVRVEYTKSLTFDSHRVVDGSATHMTENVSWKQAARGTRNTDRCDTFASNMEHGWEDDSWGSNMRGTMEYGHSGDCGTKPNSQSSDYQVTAWPSFAGSGSADRNVPIAGTPFPGWHQTLARTVYQKWEVHTGGKAFPGRKSFLVLSVSASEITDFFYPEIDFVTTSDDKPIAPTSITAGEFGSLGGDGLAVRAYGDGETHVATPSIPSCKYYRCQVFVTKHFLRSSVSCQALSNPDPERTTLGVAEQVVARIDPVPPSSLIIGWSASQGTVSQPFGSSATFTAPSSAGSATLSAAIRGEKCTINFGIIQPSSVTASRRGLQTFTRGTVGAGMFIDVLMQPTTVSFYRVEVMEPSEATTGITGYFVDHPPPSHAGNGADKWHGVACGNLITDIDFDHAESHGWLVGQAGGYTWPIHPIWHTLDSADTHSLSGWTDQVHILGSDGTMTVNKFGLSVTRRTDQDAGQ
jgi:glucodextranase-like protein